MLARHARRCVTLTLNECIRGLGPARRTLALVRIVMAWDRPCVVPACRQPAGALHGNVVRQSGQVARLRVEAAQVAVLARVLLLLHPQEEHEDAHADDHAGAAHTRRVLCPPASERAASHLRNLPRARRWHALSEQAPGSPAPVAASRLIQARTRSGRKALRRRCAGQCGMALSMSRPLRSASRPASARLGSASSMPAEARQSGHLPELFSACRKQRLQYVCWQHGSMTGFVSSSRHMGQVSE